MCFSAEERKLALKIKEVKEKLIPFYLSGQHNVTYNEIKSYLKSQIKEQKLDDYWHIPLNKTLFRFLVTEYIEVREEKGYGNFGVFKGEDGEEIWFSVEDKDGLNDFVNSNVIFNPYYLGRDAYIFYFIWSQIEAKQKKAEKIIRYITNREGQISKKTIEDFKKRYLNFSKNFSRKMLFKKDGEYFNFVEYLKSSKKVLSFHHSILGTGKLESVWGKICIYKQVNQILRAGGNISNKIILNRIE